MPVPLDPVAATEYAAALAYNLTTHDPYDVRGCGPLFDFARFCAALGQAPNHTDYRAIVPASLIEGKRIFWAFPCACSGTRLYNVTIMHIDPAGNIRRDRTAHGTICEVAWYLGAKRVPIDAPWQVVPLPEGAQP